MRVELLKSKAVLRGFFSGFYGFPPSAKSYNLILIHLNYRLGIVVTKTPSAVLVKACGQDSGESRYFCFVNHDA